MRHPALVLLVLGLAPACVMDNPAFDLCGEDCDLADEGEGTETTASTSESDSTVGETSDGDGDDDAGEEGPEEPDPGEEELGEEGPEEPDPGGTGLLPTCPAFETFEIGMVQDTFLDTSNYGFGGCVIDWNYAFGQPAIDYGFGCSVRDFGGHEDHWVCSGDQCRSVWLGEFELGSLEEFTGLATVAGARLELSARFGDELPSEARLYEAAIEEENFGTCETWTAGPGEGSLPTDCVTTGAYSAYPNPWSGDPASLADPDDLVGSADLPAYGDDELHDVEVEIEPWLVEDWLEAGATSGALLLKTEGEAPTDFNLQSSSSDNPPRMFIDLCEP